MHRIIIIVILSCAFGISYAQPKGFKNIPDEIAFRKKFSSAASTTNSIKSNFVQEKNLSVLSEKIISKGDFTFKKPNMVRMEYKTPTKYLMVINKDKITLKDGAKITNLSSKSNKVFEYINRIIIDCVQGTAFANKDFSTKPYENELQYLLVLSPIKKELKEFFSTISIYIDKKDYSVIKMDLIEPSGDNTLISFSGKSINTAISDAVFVVK